MMTRDREHGIDRQGRRDRMDTEDAHAPGKQTLTNGLMGRGGTRDSGLGGPIMRKARDDNGVAADAESAVNAAASGSGSSLPGTLQRKFESSLGTDLSSVRLHTGTASQAAASAVGAKAYTIGQNVHFGAGHYDPSSLTGQHLIAHEVAHTVQQRGGSPTRQHKLEVSTPHDAAEHEADRAADAMISGGRAAVSSNGHTISRDKDDEAVELDEDAVEGKAHESDAAQMRDEGDKRVTEQRASEAEYKRQRAGQADIGTTSVDVEHAGDIIGRIEEATGNLGMMQGHEEAYNAKGRAGVWPGKEFVPSTDAARALGHNAQVQGKLKAFQKSASRQGFQHTFFAEAYRILGEDFIRLRASIDVIKQQGIAVVGEGAKNDVEVAKLNNPALGTALVGLQAASDSLRDVATSATAGIAAAASTCGSTFDELGTQNDELKLPTPRFEDTQKQQVALAEVARINADLAMAKATISSIKSVTTTAFALATAGTSGVGMKVAEEALAGMKSKADAFATKHIDHHTDGARSNPGAKQAGKAGADAAAAGLEGALLDWMTNYSGKMAAANGKVSALNARIQENYQAIAVDKVRNVQARLADEIGKFALLLQQVEQKKQAVNEASKKVQAEASKAGKEGSNVGAAAQAMGTVSNFLVQADSTESLGRQEQKQGTEAQAKLKETAGDYHQRPGESALPGAPKELAETMPADGEQATYYVCKRAPDADTRGAENFSGYEIQKGRVAFTVNEDDAGQRSVVLKDRTEEQLNKLANWRAEATGFKAALAETLGLGPAKVR